MKWTAVTINVSRITRAANALRSLSQTFVVLSISTFLFILALGLIGYIQAHTSRSAPVSSMKGLAASVSNQFFFDIMGMEMPHLQSDKKTFTFSQRNVFNFAFRMLTDTNPKDPRTLVARELPGSEKTTVLLQTKHSGTDTPEDYTPKNQAVTGASQTTASSPAEPAKPAPASDTQTQAQPPKSAGKNVAFIYSTHNQESFLPELKGVKDPDSAYSSDVNVTSVGLRLAQSLEKEGIGTVQSKTNYGAIDNFKYPLSYSYSKKTLQEAVATHPDLKFYFDIHRDSQERSKTTVTIDGKDYAQVYFIVGGKNPNWKKNEAFAGQIHDALEAKHSGISKGIYAKTSQGNGEYNQSFSPNSILIEIGGPYNSLEECYRTADLLASAVAKVIMNAEKVDAGQGNAKSAN